MTSIDQIGLPFYTSANGLFRRFQRNPKGRDFVVGDIHGCFSLLKQTLIDVNFTDGVDRLFSVGDLTDRGPESHKVNDFLDFIKGGAVMGNHCQMIISAHADLVYRKPNFQSNEFTRNGLGWLAFQPEPWRLDLAKRLSTHPLAIEVETPIGLVGIVHAEVPYGLSWSELTNDLRSQRPNPDIIDSLLWDTNKINSFDDSTVDGVDRIYVGHTIVRRPTRLGNVFFVDTGAFIGVNNNDLSKGNLLAADLICDRSEFWSPFEADHTRAAMLGL
jgi:serine/threonine protein phosphatase 1